MQEEAFSLRIRKELPGLPMVRLMNKNIFNCGSNGTLEQLEKELRQGYRRFKGQSITPEDLAESHQGAIIAVLPWEKTVRR